MEREEEGEGGEEEEEEEGGGRRRGGGKSRVGAKPSFEPDEPALREWRCPDTEKRPKPKNAWRSHCRHCIPFLTVRWTEWSASTLRLRIVRRRLRILMRRRRILWRFFRRRRRILKLRLRILRRRRRILRGGSRFARRCMRSSRGRGSHRSRSTRRQRRFPLASGAIRQALRDGVSL